MATDKIKSSQVMDYLLTKVPTVSPDEKVGNIIKLIRNNARWETINYVYVLNESKELIGVISIKELLRSRDTLPAKKVMRRDPVGVSASSVQQRAAVVAIEKNIKAVPVFKTGTKEFLGVVGNDRILEILHHERVENLLRFSGIAKHHPTVDIFRVKPLVLFKLRIPWLLIGLVGGMMGAFLVKFFEPTLKEEIAVAFFIPVVVYISNAISTQTQALLVRLLASQKVKTLKFLKKEMLVSLTLALTSALIIGLFANFWLGSPVITLTVGLAILVSTLAAVTISVLIPLSLYAAKKDPALGSGPFATALQDVATLLIYLFIATLTIF